MSDMSTMSTMSTMYTMSILPTLIHLFINWEEWWFCEIDSTCDEYLLFSLEHVEGCLLKPILVFISYINKELSASET